MIAAEEKIRVIEQILEINDADLLRAVEGLLQHPALADYKPSPMSREAFLARIEEAEAAADRGEVTAHEDVRQLIASWKKQ